MSNRAVTHRFENFNNIDLFDGYVLLKVKQKEELIRLSLEEFKKPVHQRLSSDQLVKIAKIICP